MTINNIIITPLNWLYTQDYIIEKLQNIQKNNDATKIILYFDINNINLNTTSHDIISDFSKIIDKYITPMIDKIYGSFIFIDTNIIHLFMKTFKKMYKPLKPLFIINEDKIDDSILSDLLENNINANEYKN